MDKKTMRNMEVYVAFKLLNYKPTNEYGMYRFKLGDVSGNVQFRPMVNISHAFIVLDKLAENGYDYSIECVTEKKIAGEQLVDERGYNIYMKHRIDKEQSAITAEGTTMYEVIMKAAVDAARLIEY